MQKQATQVGLLLRFIRILLSRCRHYNIIYMYARGKTAFCVIFMHLLYINAPFCAEYL